KAGGAYVPLDPAFPAERLAFMLRDSQAPVLVTQKQLLTGIPAQNAQVVCLDSDWHRIAQESRENPICEAEPFNLAYVIYTSGSTGEAKGVEIGHGAVVNLLMSMQGLLGLTERDILLAVTTLSFDIATMELLLPLVTGAKLELVGREEAADGYRLAERLASS